MVNSSHLLLWVMGKIPTNFNVVKTKFTEHKTWNLQADVWDTPLTARLNSHNLDIVWLIANRKLRSTISWHLINRITEGHVNSSNEIL